MSIPDLDAIQAQQESADKASVTMPALRRGTSAAAIRAALTATEGQA